jgi:hypothetical protein
MGRSKRKLANIEEYNIPDSISDVTPTPHTQVHSEYASGQAARHWTIHTPTIPEPLTFPNSPDVALPAALDVALPAALDWSQANSDTSAHIEADVELTEMEDCELEALGLKQFLKKGNKSSIFPSASEKTNQIFTQSVSGFFFQFISPLTEVLLLIEQPTSFLDPVYRHLYRSNTLS